jgi:hypothetical protein
MKNGNWALAKRAKFKEMDGFSWRAWREQRFFTGAGPGRMREYRVDKR